MNDLKVKLLEELMNHLGSSQGGELKSLLDQSRAPEDKDPNGVKVESVEIMGDKPKFDQQADDAIGDVAEKKKTLGETIGYPGFPKDKKGLQEGAPDDVAMSNEGDMTDEELEELLRRSV
jgi:hypothetical protein